VQTKKTGGSMNSAIKNLFLWLMIAVVLIVIFSNYGPKQTAVEKIAYSQFIQAVDKGDIASVAIEEHNKRLMFVVIRQSSKVC